VLGSRGMKQPLLRLEAVSKTFAPSARFGIADRSRAVRAVDRVSFDVQPAETLALVGESGCGKSTTGRLILRLIEPSSGGIFYEGRDLTALSASAMRRMRRHLQMIFQDPYGSLSPRRTVGQIIAEPLNAYGITRSRGEHRERIDSLLLQVGLSPEHANRYPRQFSGGQRQRIGIARALAVGPRLIVADEPVSALDVSVQAQIINLMQDLQQQTAVAYLFIAHDLAVVRHVADRIAVMYLGGIMEIGDKRQIYSAPHHPYTQALLSAVPRPDPDAPQRRIVLEGDVPSSADVPIGCRFHTRCPLATSRCREEAPSLTEVATGHQAACHYARPNPIAKAA
jgi:oligopeptide/dipeptide ABC transporter ATP-binding protein